jgi:hypothetical protein
MEKFQARWRVILVNTEPMDQDDVEGKIQRYPKPQEPQLTLV